MSQMPAFGSQTSSFPNILPAIQSMSQHEQPVDTDNTDVQQRENDVTYYETCLVLPAKFQAAPPKANNPSVFLEDKPEQVILTRFVEPL